jgi:hypothetical protein
MKIRWIFALGVLVAVLISCQCLHKRSSEGAVRIDEHSIEIPGTAISKADQDALNKIFRKYDDSLYRIAVYENGSRKHEIGKMDEIQLADVTKDYARHASAVGLSSWIFQLGARTHVTHFPPTTHITKGQTTHLTKGETTHVTTGQPTHVTTGQPTHVTHDDFAGLTQESDALVKEVTPILEKYSK